MEQYEPRRHAGQDGLSKADGRLRTVTFGYREYRAVVLVDVVARSGGPSTRDELSTPSGSRGRGSGRAGRWRARSEEERASRTRVRPGESDAAAIGLAVPHRDETHGAPRGEREIGRWGREWRTTGDSVDDSDRGRPAGRADPRGRDDRRRTTATATARPRYLRDSDESSRSRQRLFSPRSLRPGYLSGQNGDYPNDWHCRVLTKAPIFQPDSRPRSREPRHAARTATPERGRPARRISATGERTFT